MSKFQIKSLRCPRCGKDPEVYEVTPEEYQKWISGLSPQYAFYSLNGEQMERMISGVCRRCLTSMIDIKETLT
jgi:hypothetical protein